MKQLVELCLSKETWDRPTAAQLRDICDGYLRTGVWDLSSVGGAAKPSSKPQEPSRDDRPSKRPTQRKVTTEPVVDTPPQPTKSHKDAPTMVDSPKTASKSRKRLAWIVGGAAAVIATVIVLAVLLHNPLVNPESFIVNGVTFKMGFVEGGTFQMGSEDSDAYSDEKPVHNVTVRRFYMGETEVTQALWKAVMGDNPSYFTGNDNRPVESVSWNDCQAFIQKLNQLTGKTFRLPTEAEWEYAARGGNKSKGYIYAGSNAIGKVAWCWENSSSTIHPVKRKRANELGLYDMSGNVWEWCSDWCGSYDNSSQTDPKGPSFGSYRVLRSGGYGGSAGYCRVSGRSGSIPAYHNGDCGLRLVLVN